MSISEERFKFIAVQADINPAGIQSTRYNIRVITITRTLEECLKKLNRNIDEFELYQNQLIDGEYIDRYVEKRFSDSPIEILSMKSRPSLKKYFPLQY